MAPQDPDHLLQEDAEADEDDDQGEEEKEYHQILTPERRHHARGQGTLAALHTVLGTMLFKLLGAVATRPCVPSSFTPSLGAVDRRRHGQEAAVFVMAARAVPSPGWWCWWLTDVEMVFFNPETFTYTRSFADGGVLKMTDFSKRAQVEPVGPLWWFDWHVQHVKSQTGLPVVRPGKICA